MKLLPVPSRLEDLTGKTIGEWFVVGYLGYQNGRERWLCRCSCGTEKPVQGRNLREGKSQSCGGCCEDLTGQTFHRWTVLGEGVIRNKRRYLICRCKCGTERAVHAGDLLNGSSVSCGCYKSEVLKKIKQAKLEGQRRGKLKILKKHKVVNRSVVWLCLCDCGRFHTAITRDLNSGHTYQCSVCGVESAIETRIQDLDGVTFGVTTVIRRSEKRLHGRVTQECKCICGEIHLATTHDLNSGAVQSCGCLRSRVSETLVEFALRSSRFKVHKEHKFTDCINPATGRMLRFDFMIRVNRNMVLVEYQGKQHYRFDPFFHGDESRYREYLERDAIKAQYARDHGIPLIIIPYTVEDVAGYLKEEIRKIRKA